MISEEGKYIYCIIGTNQERNFGPLGIGGRGDEVLTIGYDDLSMVASSHPMTKFVVNRENLLAHEKVIEEVMKEFDSVLPVKFGTIASSADEIRNLLDRRGREFKSALRDMDHKIELGIKGIWKDMGAIFKEIVAENKELKKAKEKALQSQKKIQAKIKLGEMVQTALAEKKEKEAEKVVDALRKTSVDPRLNKTIGDEMFINAAFLVDKGREKEFDNIMEDLSQEYKISINLKYVGPLPVYNFVNIIIYPEEWEK